MTNVDLKANVPQTMMSIVTQKIAGAILSLLMREARKVSRDFGSGEGAADSGNVYLRKLNERRELYGGIGALFDKYFDLYGEDDEEEGD